MKHVTLSLRFYETSHVIFTLAILCESFQIRQLWPLVSQGLLTTTPSLGPTSISIQKLRCRLLWKLHLLLTVDNSSGTPLTMSGIFVPNARHLITERKTVILSNRVAVRLRPKLLLRNIKNSASSLLQPNKLINNVNKLEIEVRLRTGRVHDPG